MTDVTQLMEWKERAAQHRAAAKEYSAMAAQLEAKVKAECPHPAQVRKDAYHRGGYDYKSEAVTWMECTICGHTFDRKVKYGQFE